MHTRQRSWMLGQRSRRGRAAGAVGVVTLMALLAVAAGIALALLFDSASRHLPGAAGPAASDQATPGRSAATAAPGADESKSVEAAGRGRFAGNVEAPSAILADSDGNVLYDKNADARRYPASTTKVLTALLVLENGDLNDVVRVGDEANMIEPGSSVAGLKYGEELTVSQLLYAMLIPSGNDAAYVLAAYAGRKTENNPDLGAADAVAAFVRLMNERAGELGASESHFMNPDGYQDENHYTTVRDMAAITLKAMENDTFRKIVGTKQYKLPDVKAKDKNGRTITVRRVLDNTNQLLEDGSPWHMQSCTGIKTGHTSDAGYCLVSSAEDHGHDVVAVVMGGTQDGIWRDSAALLEWGVGSAAGR